VRPCEKMEKKNSHLGFTVAGAQNNTGSKAARRTVGAREKNEKIKEKKQGLFVKHDLRKKSRKKEGETGNARQKGKKGA